jgi:hypothetical protein
MSRSSLGNVTMPLATLTWSSSLPIERQESTRFVRTRANRERGSPERGLIGVSIQSRA